MEETATALNSGAIALLRAVRRVDRETGLPPAQLSALSVLVFGGPRSLGALAAAEDVAGPTMTRIVDGLAGRGLVERQRSGDRRSVLVVATPAGRTLMRAGRRRRVEVLTEALGALSTADRRRLAAAAPLLELLAAEVRDRSQS
ncbi:MAG TPA: MarR family transcriptional regulator [Mycobacteriales bacterium]|jgi:DNA-binding MarR family transcriptional regulator|nr:MarR family transcriptional regulator [Mycobacteriales bacterium]